MSRKTLALFVLLTSVDRSLNEEVLTIAESVTFIHSCQRDFWIPIKDLLK